MMEGDNEFEAGAVLAESWLVMPPRERFTLLLIYI
jgi:hypothetical protein